MNRKLAVGRLWWKELRQLLPLVGLLFVVGLMLQFMMLATPSNFEWGGEAVMLGLPGLFAAGAGALLVGQEKELRTFDWLRSLPMSPQIVVRTKLLVGLMGLVLVWLVSLTLSAMSGSLPTRFGDSGAEWLWGLHSLFLLLVGFATAWHLRSSFVGLLVLLPLACVPLILANLHESSGDEGIWRGNVPRPWVMAFYLVLCSSIALAWGWRAALVYLSPERSSVAVSKRSSLVARTSFTAYARSNPTPALLWQFIAQNRAALSGIAAMLIASWLGLLLIVRTADYTGNRVVTGLLPLLTPLSSFLAVSWLGLLVFQGDSLQRRKQFLADRGVSPALTWITRIAVPMLVLAIVLLLFSVVLQRQAILALGFRQWLMGAASVFAIFAFSQWLGQVIRSPIVGAIVSPLISVMVVYYMVFSVAGLGAPRWSVGLLLLIPLLATYVATSAWMDGRTGWRFWSWHAGLLSLCALLPSVGFLSYMAMYPRMSAASRTELRRIANSQSPGLSWHPEVLALDSNDPVEVNEVMSGLTIREVTASEPIVPHKTMAEYRQFSIANLRSQMANSWNAGADWSTLKVILADAIVQRLADPSATNVSRQERYRESIGLLFELTKRQRKLLDLRSQDIADQLELALLQELQLSLAQERLGSELRQSLLALLGDQAGRDAARRSALASSWQMSQDANRSGPRRTRVTNTLGSYDLQAYQQGSVTARDVWESSRKAGLVSERLLKLLDAQSDQQRDKLRAEIVAIVGGPPAMPSSNAMYVETEQGQRLLYAELNYPHLPGQLWHGAWEQDAKSLSQEE